MAGPGVSDFIIIPMIPITGRSSGIEITLTVISKSIFINLFVTDFRLFLMFIRNNSSRKRCNRSVFISAIPLRSGITIVLAA